MNIPVNVLVSVERHAGGIGFVINMIERPAPLLTTDQLRLLYDALIKAFDGATGYNPPRAKKEEEDSK